MYKRSILQFLAGFTIVSLTTAGWSQHEAIAPGVNLTVAAGLGKLFDGEALLTQLDRSARPTVSAGATVNSAADAEIARAALLTATTTHTSAAIGSASASVTAGGAPEFTH